MTEEELQALRKKHTLGYAYGDEPICECCSVPYRCDTIKLLDAWEAERKRIADLPEEVTDEEYSPAYAQGYRVAIQAVMSVIQPEPVRESDPNLLDTTATYEVKQYRKKPVVVEAVQLSWTTWSEICAFVSNFALRGVFLHPTDNSVFSDWNKWENARIGAFIPTLEGEMFAIEGDYIIKGVAGEFYPCKSEIFEQTYEAVMVDTANTNPDNVRSSEHKCDHILGMDGDRVIRTSEPNGLEEIIADHDFWAFRFCPMCGKSLFW